MRMHERLGEPEDSAALGPSSQSSKVLSTSLDLEAYEDDIGTVVRCRMQASCEN